jgi:hypothetical protein
MTKPPPNINLYCDVMEEIKRRTAVVWSFLNCKSSTIYKATTIESACLQVRKILELIALASLVANKTEFAAQNEKFAKVWNARLILNDLERLNPHFYPKPIREVPVAKPGITNDLQEITDGFLTKDDFLKVYEKCGRMMHSDNPYGGKTDYRYYDKSIPKWMEKIRVLLNSHTIRLINDENMYLIHMKEDRDDKVHGYTFQPVKQLA